MATDENENEEEALERAVAEIEVLESIYGCCSDDETEAQQTSFRVVSMDALESARAILATDGPNQGDNRIPIPRLDVVVQLPLDVTDATSNNTLPDHDDSNTLPRCTSWLRCGIPAGYPISRPAIVSVDVPSLTRSDQDKLSEELRRYAEQLVGEEAVLAMAQKLQEIGPNAVVAASLRSRNDSTAAVAGDNNSDSNNNNNSNVKTTSRFSRQWLFMDHIKAESRRAQMIGEAKDHAVGGYIKPGYPGVCVLEGESEEVDQYVTWVKNIWIGRVAVRGEVTTPVVVVDSSPSSSSSSCQQEGLDGLRKLPKQLTDLGNGKILPNMGVLGSVCRTAGVEAEFLEFIMQIVR